MTTKLIRVAGNTDGAETGIIDAAKVVDGSPVPNTVSRPAFVNERENFYSGVWGSDSGKWSITYTEDEFCQMISGKAILTDEDGHSETFVAGDAFVIPSGFKGTWETVGECLKFYAVCV